MRLVRKYILYLFFVIAISISSCYIFFSKLFPQNVSIDLVGLKFINLEDVVTADFGSDEQKSAAATVSNVILSPSPFATPIFSVISTLGKDTMLRCNEMSSSHIYYEDPVVPSKCENSLKWNRRNNDRKKYLKYTVNDPTLFPKHRLVRTRGSDSTYMYPELYNNGRCYHQYPTGLRMTDAQVRKLRRMKYMIVISLRDNEIVIPTLTNEVVNFIRFVGPSNVFVSLVENNSKDKSPELLVAFAERLTDLGVHHFFITSAISDEVLAREIARGNRYREKAMRTFTREYRSELFRNQSLSRAAFTPRMLGNQFLRGSLQVGNNSRYQYNIYDFPDWEVPESEMSQQAEDALALLSEDITSKDRPFVDDRIVFLGKMRNWSIRPFYLSRMKFDKIIMMNDIFVCNEDILRLALNEGSDAVCAMDYVANGFYDSWVHRDENGNRLNTRPPHYKLNHHSNERFRRGAPVPVQCCWNGMIVLNATAFYDNFLIFRNGLEGECKASECSLLCHDMSLFGFPKYAVDPHVQVAYTTNVYSSLTDIIGNSISTDRYRFTPIKYRGNSHLEQVKFHPRDLIVEGDLLEDDWEKVLGKKDTHCDGLIEKVNGKSVFAKPVRAPIRFIQDGWIERLEAIGKGREDAGLFYT